jgi:hypothetical protein
VDSRPLAARPAEDQPLLSGRLSTEILGTGAAPFGIASGVLTGSGFGYNLARLTSLQMPENLDWLGSNERYRAVARFQLRPDGEDRWVLHSLRVDYLFDDRTLIEYEGASIRDSLGDAGTVGWRDGKWRSGPRIPEEQPMVVLERSGADTWTLRARIVHPMMATGSSLWTSPMGEIRVDASAGQYSYTGRDFADRPIPLPPIDLDLATDMSWSLEYSQTYSGSGPFPKYSDVFTTMTGATAYQTAEFDVLFPRLYRLEPDWWPEVGEIAEVEAKVEGSDPKPLRWRFTLYDISREMGERLNFPPRPAGGTAEEQTYDYRLMSQPGFEPPQEVGGGSKWIVETSEPRSEVTLHVLSEDYGGWAKLQAHVLLEDEWVPVPVAGSEKDYVTLPLDEAGDVENHIADGWEAKYRLAGVDAEQDEDRDPKSAHTGDGLSVYEEYRGFKLSRDPGGRSHVRTDPKVKDLFLYPEDDSFLAGIRLFGQASGIRTHVLAEGEYTGREDRVVNFNRGAHSVCDQHALYLRLATESEQRTCAEGESYPACGLLLGGTSGLARGVLPSPPVGTTEILIAQWVAGRTLTETVAHEVGHGVGARHHGDAIDFRKVCRVGDTYVRCGSAATGRRYWIAALGGEHSGRSECLMIYHVARGYTPTASLQDVAVNRDGSPRRFPNRATHESFCSSSAAGRGNPVGPASAGDCSSQFRVSDAQ